MLVNIGNFLRMLVRPAVTVGLVAATCYAALTKNMEAAKEIGTYTAVVIVFWFSDRSQQNKPANGGDN